MPSPETQRRIIGLICLAGMLGGAAMLLNHHTAEQALIGFMLFAVSLIFAVLEFA